MNKNKKSDNILKQCVAAAVAIFMATQAIYGASATIQSAGLSGWDEIYANNNEGPYEWDVGANYTVDNSTGGDSFNAYAYASFYFNGDTMQHATDGNFTPVAAVSTVGGSNTPYGWVTSNDIADYCSVYGSGVVIVTSDTYVASPTKGFLGGPFHASTSVNIVN